MDYIAQPKDYWIAQGAITITLNALGNPNRTQGSVASGAAILCYIEGVDGLGYDNGHRFKTWPLSLSPTYFNSNTQKYVYAAIPRSASVGTQAVVVFPSEKLDVYGKNSDGAQVGSSDYYYIWLQGIISSSGDYGTTNRTWTEEMNFGKKGTDEDLYDDTDGEWYQYSKVSEIVTFLKNITMKAGTTFYNLYLGYKELTGVTTATTGEDYVDSETLVATPSYIHANYLRKNVEDTAEEQIGFLKGIWIGIKDLYEITADGIAKFKSLFVDDITAQRMQVEDMQSSNYTGDGIADTGWRLTKDYNGHSKLTVDELYVRMKAVFEALEVKKELVSGGNQVQSCAASVISKVDYLNGNKEVIGYDEYKVPFTLRNAIMMLFKGQNPFGSYSRTRRVRLQLTDADRQNVRYVRCYFLAEEGGRKIQNWWRVADPNDDTTGNDLARCQTFNLASDSISERDTYFGTNTQKQGNIFWWRKLAGVSTTPVEIDGKQYHYFDVYCNPTAEAATPYSYSGAMEGSDIPAPGDEVSQWGNDNNIDRMNLIVQEVNGQDAAIKMYEGINQFSMETGLYGNPLKIRFAPKTGCKVHTTKWEVVTETFIAPIPVECGNWSDITPDSQGHRTCRYYEIYQHNGGSWLCVASNGGTFKVIEAFSTYAVGDTITQTAYDALTVNQQMCCARVSFGTTTDEPSTSSPAWRLYASKGEKGDGGDTPIQLFKWSQTAPSAPAVTASQWATQDPYDGWYKQAQNRPSGDGYILYMSQNTLTGAGTIDSTAWSTPIQISGNDGNAGEDASDQEFVYMRLNVYPFPNNVTKPADATRGKIHGTGDWVSAANQYGVDDWVPEGWSDTALPVAEDNQYVYAAIRTKAAGYDEDWNDFGEPFLWGNWGRQGIDGDGVQYVYKLFDHELTDAERTSNIPTKPASQTQGEWIPTGWSDDPLAPTISMQYCYCSTIKKIDGEWASTFDKLGLWSRFSKDGQSAYKSTMFVRLNTTPTKPADNKGSYANPSPSDCPAGTSGGSTIYWSDGIPSGEAQIWATSRIFTSDGQSPQQSSWSTPQPMSDTNTFDVEFAVMQTNDAVPATPTANNRHKDAYPYGYEGQVWFDPDLDKYSASGVLRDFTGMYWRAERECKNGVWGDWTVLRIKGEKGDKGSFKSRVFCRTNSTPDTPQSNTPTGTTYNTYDNPVPPPVTGQPTWTDGIPQGTAILWSSVCTFYANGTNSGWGTPAPETDTADLDIEFSPSTSEPSVPQGNTPFADHSSEGWYDPSHLPAGQTMIWRAERKVKNGVYNGDWVITRIYGETGDAAPYYVEDYGIGASRTSHSDISSWSSNQPEPTAQKPYVWKRSRLYNPNTQTYGNATYVCLTGEKGVNGKDGWMITANPANVIITQALGNDTTQFSTVKVGFTAKKGSVAATVSSLAIPTGKQALSSEFNAAIGTGDDAKKVIVSSPKTYTPQGGTIQYYTEGTFEVVVNVTDPDTNTNVAFNVTVPCYANLLGTWKQTVVGDAESVAAAKVAYIYDPNNPNQVVKMETFGDYVRSSTENSAKLERDTTEIVENIANTAFEDIEGTQVALSACEYIVQLKVDTEDLPTGNYVFDFAGFHYEGGEEFIEQRINVSAGTYTITLHDDIQSGNGVATMLYISRVFNVSSEITQTADSINARVDASNGRISQLEVTANGLSSTVKDISPSKNLLKGSLSAKGWLSSPSDIADSGVPYTSAELDNDGYIVTTGNHQYLAQKLTLSGGKKYTLSFYSKKTTAITVTVWIVGYPTMKQAFTVDATDASVRKTVSIEIPLGFGGNMGISINATNIKQPQLEEGDTATDFIADSTEISSGIIQTADKISLGVQTDIEGKLYSTGININGNNRTIRLDADKVEISDELAVPKVISQNDAMITTIEAGQLVIRSKRSSSYGIFAINSLNEIVLQMYDKDGVIVLNLGGTPNTQVNGEWEELEMRMLTAAEINSPSKANMTANAVGSATKPCTKYYRLKLGKLMNSNNTLEYYLPNGTQTTNQNVINLDGCVFTSTANSESDILSLTFISLGFYVFRNDGIFKMIPVSPTESSKWYENGYTYNNGKNTAINEYVFTS